MSRRPDNSVTGAYYAILASLPIWALIAYTIWTAHR